MGYLCYDFLIQKYFVRGTDGMALQTLLHHCLGIASIFGANFCGFGFSAIGCLLLAVELSTPFLNYRVCYGKEEIRKTIP